MPNSVTLPRSVSHPFSSALGVAAFLAAFYFCRQQGVEGVNAALLMLFSYAGALFLSDILIFRSPADPRNELDFSRMSFSGERSFYKLVGVAASFLFLGFLFWLFPEYHFNIFGGEQNGFYIPLGQAFTLLWPVGLVVGIPYIVFVDAVMQQPKDRYYWLGRLVLRKDTEITRSALIQHCYIWICRGYFVALLFVYFSREIQVVLDMAPMPQDMGVAHFYYEAFHLISALLFTIAVAGFLFPLRLMGTHIRSIDPTLFGWWVCLFFYQPFQVFANMYFGLPAVDEPWIDALQGLPMVQQAWCGMLLLFLVGQVTADATLGSRFGQMMHRGIVTNGMYRYTKHPSYIFAVLFIWFTFMPPLIYSDLPHILHTSFGLSGLTLVYYLRARTEERHLARDPDYVAYALWIEQHGLFRFLGEWFPIMRFIRPSETSGIAPAIYRGFAYP